METRWGKEEDWYLEYVWNEHQYFYKTSIEPHLDKVNMTDSIVIQDVKSISDGVLKKLIATA